MSSIVIGGGLGGLLLGKPGSLLPQAATRAIAEIMMETEVLYWKLPVDRPMLENDPGWRERGGACIECRHQVGKLSFPPIVRPVPDRFGALTHKTRTGPVALRPKHKRSDAGCASAHWRVMCAGEQRRRTGVDILAFRPRPVPGILRTTDMRPAIATDLQGGRCMTTRPCAMRRMGSWRDVRRSGACGLQAGMR